MAQFKGTQGEWSVNELGDIVSNGEWAIAGVYGTGNDDADDANAKLLAASKDLLEAAEAALKHAEAMRECWRNGEVSSCNGRSGYLSNVNVDVETQLRAAIERATV